MNTMIISLDLLSAVVTFVLMANMIIEKHKPVQSKIFTCMLITNFVMLLFDALFFICVGNPQYTLLIKISLFCTFTIAYILPIFFGLLVFTLISQYTTFSRWVMRIVTAICGVMMLLCCISLFNGIVFSVENGEYIKGPLYAVSQIVPIVLILFVLFPIIKYRKMLDAKAIFALISYILMPFFAFVLQLIINSASLIFVAITISMLVIYVSITTREVVKAREKDAELAETKMQLVISQIRPHFIFNTLNAISYLCRQDPELAEETVSVFAQYLRGNLDFSSTKKFIPFSSELGHIKAYLHIEKLRFDERINVIYNIECDSFMIPSLSVQPIVENAVKHGICKRDEGGTITITSRKNKNNYEIIVEDDGVGFDMKEQAKDGRSHIGIDNVRKRLEMLCSGTLDIKSEVGKGTTSTIRIPVRKRYGRSEQENS